MTILLSEALRIFNRKISISKHLASTGLMLGGLMFAGFILSIMLILHSELNHETDNSSVTGLILPAAISLSLLYLLVLAKNLLSNWARYNLDVLPESQMQIDKLLSESIITEEKAGDLRTGIMHTMNIIGVADGVSGIIVKLAYSMAAIGLIITGYITIRYGYAGSLPVSESLLTSLGLHYLACLILFLRFANGIIPNITASSELISLELNDKQR